MDSQPFSNRLLLPKPPSLVPQDQPQLNPLEAIPSGVVHQSRSRGPKSAAIPKQTWELHKEVIYQLYWERDLQLPEVMKEMESRHDFRASKQYTKQLKDWNLDKNIKAQEKMAIIRKTTERLQQDPSKQSTFRVRGRHVDPEQIERFKRDKNLEEGDIVMIDMATPSDISYNTPQSQHSSPTNMLFRSIPRHDRPFNLSTENDQVLSVDSIALLQLRIELLSQSLKHRDVPETSVNFPHEHTEVVPGKGLISTSPRLPLRASPHPAQRIAMAMSPSPQPSVEMMEGFEAFVGYSSASRSQPKSIHQLVTAFQAHVKTIRSYEDQRRLENLQLQYRENLEWKISCSCCRAMKTLRHIQNLVAGADYTNPHTKAMLRLLFSAFVPTVSKMLDTGELYLERGRLHFAMETVWLATFILDRDDALSIFRTALHEINLHLSPNDPVARTLHLRFAAWPGQYGNPFNVKALHIIEEILGSGLYEQALYFYCQKPKLYHKFWKWAGRVLEEPFRTRLPYYTEGQVLVGAVMLLHHCFECNTLDDYPEDQDEDWRCLVDEIELTEFDDDLYRLFDGDRVEKTDIKSESRDTGEADESDEEEESEEIEETDDIQWVQETDNEGIEYGINARGPKRQRVQ